MKKIFIISIMLGLLINLNPANASFDTQQISKIQSEINTTIEQFQQAVSHHAIATLVQQEEDQRAHIEAQESQCFIDFVTTHNKEITQILQELDKIVTKLKNSNQAEHATNELLSMTLHAHKDLLSLTKEQLNDTKKQLDDTQKTIKALETSVAELEKETFKVHAINKILSPQSLILLCAIAYKYFPNVFPILQTNSAALSGFLSNGKQEFAKIYLPLLEAIN